MINHAAAKESLAAVGAMARNYAVTRKTYMLTNAESQFSTYYRQCGYNPRPEDRATVAKLQAFFTAENKKQT